MVKVDIVATGEILRVQQALAWGRDLEDCRNIYFLGCIAVNYFYKQMIVVQM
jgi:hypothetical protein